MIFFYNNAEFQSIDFIQALNAANALLLIIGMVGFNAIAEMIVCGILGTAIAKPIDKLNINNSI